ncbi:MAG: PorP/SprF family type IX secretion system membrane protein [Flavobacteriales bacterium]
MVKNRTSYLKKLFLPLLLFPSFSLCAQDIHFTQFYEPAMTLNPSNAGKFNGDWRFNGIYRSQWSAIVKPFVTTALGYDQPLTILDQNFGVGGYYVFDRSGDGRLTMNKVMLSLAYHKNFSGNLISLGVQGGYVNKNINYSYLTFPGQYDNSTGGFNGNLSNGESFANDKINYLDLNAGFGWSRRISSKLAMDLGYSLFHFNSPKETFMQQTNQLQRRHVVNASARYDLNSKSFLTPNFLYMYDKKASDLVVGANYNYKMMANKMKLTTVFAGIVIRDGFARTFDATSVIFGAEIRDFRVGIAYDINMSQLSSATNYRGAFEIAITYIARSSLPEIYTVPCDIY